MILETKRLLLRPLTMADAPQVYAYSREQNVGPNAGWKPHESIGETRGVLKAVFLGRDGIFAMVLRETDRIIGSVGLLPDPKRQNDAAMMLGYAMSETQWGRGLMPEAADAVLHYGFDTLGLALISAYVYPDNRRSARVLEKLGFTREGRLRRCEELYNGRILDNDCYSLLRQEFQP